MIKTSQPKVTKLKIRQKLCETLGVKTRLCYNIGSKCLSAAKMSPVRTSCHAKDLHTDPRTEHRTQNADPRTELFLPMYNSVPSRPFEQQSFTRKIMTERQNRNETVVIGDKMQFPPHVASTVSLQIWKQINHVKQSGASNSVDSFWQDTQPL